MKLRIPFLLALVLPLAITAVASAVIIDSGIGTGNTTAPSPDPGWSNVGICNFLSCVYLGNGWVLTANHVGAGDAYFGGVQYPWVTGTDVRLHNPDNSLADLRMFTIYPPYPPLPSLAIRSTTPGNNAALTLIGNGRNRGSATTWNPCVGGSYDGYQWGPAATMRWGTNRREIAQQFSVFFGTWVFGTEFDENGPGHTTHEAQGATGDSGGAAFALNGTTYELAGILIGIGTLGFGANGQCPEENQPAETALYGNATYAADLSIYHDEIVETMPEPDGGLFAGAVLLAMLSRRITAFGLIRPTAGTRRACRGTGCAASSPPRA